MRVLPEVVRRMTPREFYIVATEEQEVRLDQLEMQALQAFMNEKAARTEKLKLKDIYERPTQDQLTTPQKSKEELYAEQMRQQQENDALLAQLRVQEK
ncbi:hypothetical protein HB904_04540 [Listeria booriae]|uniref:Uncharacterized protein n=1 Tax=Listeria booriae TaxID=1552123 RepID=A0A842AGQ1_9LIST|nr:hypothetical protein [Listeria booriae]